MAHLDTRISLSIDTDDRYALGPVRLYCTSSAGTLVNLALTPSSSRSRRLLGTVPLMSSFKLESNSKFQLPDIQESTPSESLGTQHTDVFLFDFSGTEINTPAIFRTSFRRSNPGDMQLLGARDNMPLRGQKSGQGRNARDMPTTRLTIAVGVEFYCLCTMEKPHTSGRTPYLMRKMQCHR
jgi:hypothetical protein